MEIDDDEPLEEEEDRLDVTSTGRKRRNAAKRASEKLSATISYGPRFAKIQLDMDRLGFSDKLSR